MYLRCGPTSPAVARLDFILQPVFDLLIEFAECIPTVPGLPWIYTSSVYELTGLFCGMVGPFQNCSGQTGSHCVLTHSRMPEQAFCWNLIGKYKQTCCTLCPAVNHYVHCCPLWWVSVSGHTWAVHTDCISFSQSRPIRPPPLHNRNVKCTWAWSYMRKNNCRKLPAHLFRDRSHPARSVKRKQPYHFQFISLNPADGSACRLV